MLGLGIANQSIKDYFDKENIKYLIYDDYKEVYNLEVNLENIDYIIKSAGISNEHDIIKQALKRNIIIISDLELFYLFFPFVKLITITGSNGKTTTTSLIYEIIKASQKEVNCGGNIGIPLFQYAESKAMLVCEASSFMLEYTKAFKSHYSIILNITNAHLDHHKSLRKYIKAKERLINNQTKFDYLFYNIDDNRVNKIAQKSKAIKIPFSLHKQKKGIYINNNQIIYNHEIIIDNINDWNFKGVNIYNVLASIIVALHLDIDKSIIKNTILNFKGIEHRLEYVGLFKDKKVYNDSKATNLLALKNALSSFGNNKILLICGGKKRKDNFKILDKNIQNLKYVLVYGENKGEFKKYFEKKKIDVIIFDTLKEVVSYLHEIEIEEDIILFSPGSASYDQYANYEERGRIFKSYMV